MIRSRSIRGLSAVEILISAAFAFGLLSGAVSMAASSADLARGSAAEDAVARRVSESLATVSDAIRKASLASIRKLDGTEFADGESDVGFTGQPVIGFEGVPLLGPETTVRLDVPPGGGDGEILRNSGGIVERIARGVTEFKITRTGDAFVVAVRARSGDRNARRVATASLTAHTRNP